MRYQDTPTFVLAAFLGISLCLRSVRGAELSVGSLTLAPGASAQVSVGGGISGEATFGVSILVELVPRPGNTGLVQFTSSPPVDIDQSGDPWPGAGTFTAFDTSKTGSLTLNGSIDDDGVFVPQPVTFAGALSSFPVMASPDANGIWDILLSTSAGDSSWEGLGTTLIPGTICVRPGDPAVNLAFLTSTGILEIGDTLVVRFMASSATCDDHPVGSIEAIILWDPAVLALQAKIDDGPIVWPGSGFPNDSALDGLNAPYTGLPANDGDAWYVAQAGSSEGISVPTDGLHVTTFEFQAVGGTAETALVIAPSEGSFTVTRVLGAGPLAGQIITGSLDSTTIVIQPAIPALGDLGVVTLSLGMGAAGAAILRRRRHIPPNR